MKRNGESVFGGENMASIILAVVAVIGLIFLAVELSTLFLNKENKNAEAFIDNLNSKIEALEDGQSNTFALQGVEGWVLVGWNKEIPLDKKPERCFDKNCLCICKDSDSNCQDRGYCRFPDRNIAVSSEYKFFLAQGQYSIKSDFAPCYIMPLGSKLIPFSVKKDATTISISGPLSYISNQEDRQLVKTSCTALGGELSFA